MQIKQLTWALAAITIAAPGYAQDGYRDPSYPSRYDTRNDTRNDTRSSRADRGDRGTVLSSTPVLRQVLVPRTVCGTERIPPQKSGAGALIGAIAGGAIGNAIGAGAGRAAATGLGLVGGAALGDNIEGGGSSRDVQRCSTQNAYEPRTVAYDVVYEFAGREYRTQMRDEPGRTIPVEVTPVGERPRTRTAPPPPRYRQDRDDAYAAAPAYAPPLLDDAYPAAPAVVLQSPYDFEPSYYAPIGVGIAVGALIGYGFRGGYGHGGYWHGGYGGHRGWRGGR